ncbi:Schizosaccharomyces specific protein [Schizosaccharomyces osmophilus]|uniref:Schizosaccharomyces specific protein n=1 Tax=Schizosaccharomyces osmophilus TaxID=2545709 RepID=A0AAE9WG74_9SCHI|nr:Schizosaccharomyces specific protein [Schizosaccharomyces osmophilus]WBW74637.1 Schizosaccharomyces specific protein [Schizosaccharomyces osmophilus]
MEGHSTQNEVVEYASQLGIVLDEVFLNVGYLLRSLLANVPNALYHTQLQGECHKFQDYCDLIEVRLLDAKKVLERDLRILEAAENVPTTTNATVKPELPMDLTANYPPSDGNTSALEQGLQSDAFQNRNNGGNFFNLSPFNSQSMPNENAFLRSSDVKAFEGMNVKTNVSPSPKLKPTTSGVESVGSEARSEGYPNLPSGLPTGVSRENDAFQFSMPPEASSDQALQANEYLLPNVLGNTSTSPQDNLSNMSFPSLDTAQGSVPSNYGFLQQQQQLVSPSSKRPKPANASYPPSAASTLDTKTQENYSAAFGNDNSFAAHLNNSFGNNSLGLPTDMPSTESINDLFGESFDFTMSGNNS